MVVDKHFLSRLLVAWRCATSQSETVFEYSCQLKWIENKIYFYKPQKQRNKTWWRHQMETFPALLTLCEEIHRWPVDSPNKSHWHGALMFSLICAWTNGWANDWDAGDLRSHRAYYDVTVMYSGKLPRWSFSSGISSTLLRQLRSKYPLF